MKRHPRFGVWRLNWLIYAIVFLIIHSLYACVVHLDLQYGTRLIQHSLLIIDPVAVAWAIRRDASGSEFLYLLLLIGGVWWCLMGAAVGAVVWWRANRLIPGHCTNCDYDLQGNTTGVCPECGAPITPRDTP